MDSIHALRIQEYFREIYPPRNPATQQDVDNVMLTGPAGAGKDTVLEQSLTAARIHDFMSNIDRNSIYQEFLSTYSAVPCSHMKRLCPSEAEVTIKGYVETAARVMAGVMLAMTGAFYFAPELAKDFFPWAAE